MPANFFPLGLISHHKGRHGQFDLGRIPASRLGAGGQRRHDDFSQVAFGVQWMPVQPVGHFTRQLNRTRVDARHVNRDLWMFDWAGVKKGSHQAQSIIFTLEGKLLTALPTTPKGPQRPDEFAHLGQRRIRPIHAKAPANMRPHLRPEPQDEAAIGSSRQVPGRVSHGARTAGQGDGDGSSQLDLLTVFSGCC